MEKHPEPIPVETDELKSDDIRTLVNNSIRELDKDYYDAAIKRINNRINSLDLFDLIRQEDH